MHILYLCAKTNLIRESSFITLYSQVCLEWHLDKQGIANAHAISIIQTVILFSIPSMPVRTCSAGYFFDNYETHKWIKTKQNKKQQQQRSFNMAVQNMCVFSG